MKKAAVALAMIALVASLGTCAWSAKSAGEAVRPVEAPEFGPMMDRAAEAAQGLRVLAIVAKPGAAPTGEIYETARGPDGWRAYPPTPAPDDPLLPALSRLASEAAADFAGDRRFEEATAKALAVMGVRVVVATDGREPIYPDVHERDEPFVALPAVPGVSLRHAQPAFLFLAEEPAIASDDAVGFRRALRAGDAPIYGYEDHAAYGGDVKLESDRDAEYLFPWTAAGAKVEIDGVAAPTRAARVPVLLVKVPAGLHVVSVRYGDEALARQWLVIAASLGVVASLVTLWLGLRPKPGPAPPA